MPSHQNKNKRRWMQATKLLSQEGPADSAHQRSESNGNNEPVATTAAADAHVSGDHRARSPHAISTPSPKHLLRRTGSSLLGGGDVDEDMQHSGSGSGSGGGGGNVNGVTSASPAPSHSSVSSPSESDASPPAAALLTMAADGGDDMSGPAAGAAARGDEEVGDGEAELAVAVAGAAAADTAAELFYVELDPDTRVMTGVLPEMQRLHVRLMHIVQLLHRKVERLLELRGRAKRSGHDLCEVKVPKSPLHPSRLYTAPLVPPPPQQQPQQQHPAATAAATVHRHTDTMGSNGSGGAERMGSPRQNSPLQPPFGVVSTPRDNLSSRLTSARQNSGHNRYSHSHTATTTNMGTGQQQHPPHPQQFVDEGEWCDAATLRSSRSTTARSTPSLQPCQPAPSLQFFEEDELDDDGRGSLFMSSLTGGRRSYAARFRPDSVPSSVQSTPNMVPAMGAAPYARSDNGGLLSLPPSTSAMARMPQLLQHHASPPQQLRQQHQVVPSPLKRGSVSQTACGSTMSQLDTGSGTLASPTSAPPPAAAASAAAVVDSTPPQDMWASFPSPPSAIAPTPGTTAASLHPGLTDEEKKELRRLSARVAELYSRRGALLQQADRILCRHAQQHERWEGNEERRGCYRCRRLFSRLTRRHHCRRCGRLCCAECSRYVGKKQDTSYVAAPSPMPDAGTAALARRVMIKSEYTARLTAADPRELPEKLCDEHTYPHRTFGSAGDSPLAQVADAGMQETGLVLDDQVDGPSRDAGFDTGADAVDHGAAWSRQHKWVRVCAPCYQNCLRARRDNVLQHIKSANLCILDDGFYYYHVMTSEELCRLSTALNKPDSFKKQVELMSHVVVERSADYVAAAPAYSAQTLTAAAQHTPDVLRTLGSIGAYAFRSARQTANDYVGGYFAASRTILPDKHALSPSPRTVARSGEADRTGNHNTGDDDSDKEDAQSAASLVSVDDECSETQSPLKRREETAASADTFGMPSPLAQEHTSEDNHDDGGVAGSAFDA